MNKEYNHNTSVLTLGKGELLFQEGEASDFIYYIEQGSLEVFTEMRDRRIVLSEVKTGEFVGELGVLLKSERYASVIALQDSTLLKLDETGFIQMIAHDPDKSVRLLHSLSCRTRNTGLLSKQIAEQIAEIERQAPRSMVNHVLAYAGYPFNYARALIYNREKTLYEKSLPVKLNNGLHKIKKGRVLFCEEHESHYACRVISGRFRVVKSLHNRFEDIGYIGPGEFIGEIGLLEGTPRSLTVIADEPSTVEVFDEEAFLQLIISDFENALQLIKALAMRAAGLYNQLRGLLQMHANILDPSLQVQARKLMRNIGDVSLLTGRMLERDLTKLKYALKEEASAVQGMIETYYRYLAGDADKQEMEQANAEFRNFLKTLGLGALLIIPGSFITIPLIVKLSKSLGIDVLPKSRLEVTDVDFERTPRK